MSRPHASTAAATALPLLALLAALLAPAPAVAQPVYQLVGCTASSTGDPTTTSRIVDVDIATGAVTNPRDTGIYFLGGIAFYPQTGSLLSLATFASVAGPNAIFMTSLQTGHSTMIGATGFARIFEGDLARNPADGFYYGLQEITVTSIHRYLFRVNPQSGIGTIVGDLPFPGDYSAMAFTEAGELYVVQSQFGTNNDALLRVNPNTAAVIATTALNVRLGDQAGMAIHPLTGAVYLAGGGDDSTNAKLFELNLNTGAATVIGNFGNGIIGLSGLTFVPVPEPGALVYVMLACGCGTARVWRRGVSDAWHRLRAFTESKNRSRGELP